MCPDQERENTKVGSLGDYDLHKTEHGGSITSRSSDRSISVDFEKRSDSSRRGEERSSYTAGISKHF